MTTTLTSCSRLLFKTVACTCATGPVISRYTTTMSALALLPSLFSSVIHHNDPEVLEREKHKNLNKTQHTTTPHNHAPGWHQENSPRVMY
ncbi:hypothetical protein BDP27DRAFT_638230 [Rhodocollybia butyracea]|uniref:Uncharacterized protein n=1 Tax=Rhodocollybia butyracea TaxID=206335 RepID=A0A9P5P752_9AGAR|nr:hypothetical protein BDP27DRAFT_638230 [Rhodocollybia butyracea]